MTPALGADDGMLIRRLNEYLAAQGVGRRVSALNPLKLGWESRVFAAEMDGEGIPSQVLRLYFGADGGMTALREFRALTLLHELDYPVPQPRIVEPSAQPLGSPFLMMAHAAGASPKSRVFRQESEADHQFVAVFCMLLARLHTLDWQGSREAARVQKATIDEQLHGWASFAQRFPSDTAHPALNWLVEGRAQVTPLPLRPVHWDFHHENVLVDGAGRATVIDWTQFQATDARFDLAWTLTLLRSYAGEQVAETVLTGYRDALPVGHELRSLSDLAWFEAAACAKRLLSVTIALKHGAASLGMRPGAETTIAQGFGALAQVYRRWLALTGVPLDEVAELMGEHL